MKNILAIVGSASKNSSNLKLINLISKLTKDKFSFTIIDDLSILPHFNPELTDNNTPQVILDFRDKILKSDGVMICTPEYVFSIPSGLKNSIEWCVSTTVFSKKPVGLITASANGQKGHEELQFIMKTIEAKFNEGTTLLIKGIKGKVDEQGEIANDETIIAINQFINYFEELINNR